MSNVTKKSEPQHLFRLSSELMDSFDIDDVNETFGDMAEMGIANPPYMNFAIEINEKFFEKFKLITWGKNISKPRNAGNYDYIFEYNFCENASPMRVNGAFFIVKNGKKINILERLDHHVIMGEINNKQYELLEKVYKYVMHYLSILLVVVLATKNHVKEDKLDKDLLRGRYNKKQAYRKDYPITTTISIGKITESYKSSNGGGTVRPHMRRGHIRSQHYGPNNELMKKIFIQPVFVNADEGWIAERRAYNVKKEDA
jgi:hypothetical protein